MNVMYVGEFGNGKTFNAIMDALLDDGDYIYTNQPIDGELAKECGFQEKEIVTFDSLKDIDYDSVKCGIFLLDECQFFVGSGMKKGELPKKLSKLVYQKRKIDVDFIYTTPASADVAKAFRRITHEIRLVKRISLPIIGFVFKKCVMPTCNCASCNRKERDQRPDDDRWWKRILGFGTVFQRLVLAPDIVLKMDDANGFNIEDDDVLRKSYRLFNVEVAKCYGTHYRIA